LAQAALEVLVAQTMMEFKAVVRLLLAAHLRRFNLQELYLLAVVLAAAVLVAGQTQEMVVMEVQEAVRLTHQQPLDLEILLQ
jgi:hypothetical protein